MEKELSKEIVKELLGKEGKVKGDLLFTFFSLYSKS